MRTFIYKLTLLWGIVLAGITPAHSQTGAGSSTADNTVVTIAAGATEQRFSESSYFGPDAQWEINGTLEIWSKKIWISPTARFTGTGKIIIHDPGTNPYYLGMTAGATQIDGNNGHHIETTIQLSNPANLVLTDLPDPGYHKTNPTLAKAGALNIGGVFEFTVDGADVLLNGYDLGIASTGTLIGYNSNRMIVTGNSIAGHVIKSFSAVLPFVFPIGITEGDYTPATLTPTGASTLYVSVQDYAGSTITKPLSQKGMDRIWHIYASSAINTTYTLQHNSITNGSAYLNETAEIMQYAGSGNWLGGSTVLQPPSTQTRAGIITTAQPLADASWFTKLNVLIGPSANNDNDDKAIVVSGAPIQVNVLENDKPGSSPIVVASVRITEYPKNGAVKVNSDGSVTYISQDGYVGEDTFVYEITDENGLKSTAKVMLKVSPRPLQIPNVFTPNGDGKNDVFKIIGLEGFEKVNVKVFNRWGNEVYNNGNYKNDWDGSNLNEGTYYYLIVLNHAGKTENYKGWVLIKR
ncbi:gliding motility-associated C-terminal domain-containing protein [Pedobacter gandavensis]|uniref:T9SS type B sorting domain-containing protein n=1 Tax=Pedobacter gandavensis TaxID=2679963 RepID=UPI00292E4EF2|nr:gliding motility-associated C-terminal domain-containing protein [Pedobacter gandavensis]